MLSTTPRIAPNHLSLSLVLLLAIPLAFTPQAQGAEFTVNNTSDQVDATPGDGVCASASGTCTLRAAVMETNALPGDDTVRLPSGVVLLAIAGTFEEGSAMGDLDILDGLTLLGEGMTRTGVDASGLGDRILHVQPGARLTLRGVSLVNADIGSGSNGAGLLNDEGTVLIEESSFQWNHAHNGAGLMNTGEMVLRRSLVWDNSATDAGAGIRNDLNLEIDGSAIGNNRVQSGPGGGVENHGSLVIRNTTITANRASNRAAAIYNGYGPLSTGASLIINNSTIFANLVETDSTEFFDTGGIYNEDLSIVHLDNTILAGNAYDDQPSNCIGTLASAEYSLLGNLDGCSITGGTTGSLFGVDDPQLGPLTENEYHTAAYPLLPGSPAIDAGNPARVGSSELACEAVDQRGFARPIGSACDIGAIESEFGAQGTPSLTPTDTGSPADTTTATSTGSLTPTWTATLTFETTPSVTPTGTLPTRTPSATRTKTNTPAITLTFSPTTSLTASDTPTATLTATATAVPPTPPPYWTVGSDVETGAFFGGALAFVDPNADGYADVLIGAGSHTEGQHHEGAAFLYSASAAGPGLQPDWSVQSNQASAVLGNPLDTAGDLNSDGFEDLVVSAYLYSAGQTSEGAAFAYHGSPTGPSASANWMAEGNQTSALFGWAVSGVGDVNGDGFDDVAIGARYYDHLQTDEGAAYLYLGSASGLQSSPAWQVEGEADQVGMGYAVAGAGDVNGDGYDDVLVSAVLMEPTENEGTVYLFTGSPSGLSTSPAWSIGNALPNDGFGADLASAGDINRDGFDDFLIGAPGDAYLETPGRAYLFYGSPSGPGLVPGWIGQDGTLSSRFGAAVASAGDFNADGYPDIAIGAPNYYLGGSYGIVGRLALYLGSSVGLGPDPDWTFYGQNNSDFARSLANSKDSNGDGYDDLLVGAQNWDNEPFGEGRAFVFFGWPLASSQDRPTPGPSPTPWPSRTPTRTITPSPTATPTATPSQTPSPTLLPEPVFADDFESGQLLEWYSSQTDQGDLSVTTASAIGGAFGLQAVLDDNRSIFVVDDAPSAETSYRARFYFDPNSISMASGNAHVMLLARDAAAVAAFRVEFRSFQGDYQVRAVAPLDDAPAYITPWLGVADAPHYLEISWWSASGEYVWDGGLHFFVDGELLAGDNGLDNDTHRVDSVRLGAVSGVDGGTRGTYFFDSFYSTRGLPIGPDPGASLPSPTRPPDSIFADGFESADVSAWSAVKSDGDLLVTGAAALDGAFGLEAVIDGTTPLYLTDWSPVAEREYRAQFIFDPNSLRMLDGRSHLIFQALAGASQAVARVEVRYKSGNYELRSGILSESSGWANTSWWYITDAPHVIEIEWRASDSVEGSNGRLTMWINEIQSETREGVRNDGLRVDLVRLGAVAGLDSGTLGTMYFDGLWSRRGDSD